MHVCLFVFLAAAQAAPQPAATKPVDLCDRPDTASIVQCLQGKVANAEKQLAMYAAEVKRIIGPDQESLNALDRAQDAWSKFVDADCHAAYTINREGTIREPAFIGCRLEHTEHRSVYLWNAYLQGMATELPKPKEQ